MKASSSVACRLRVHGARDQQDIYISKRHKVELSKASGDYFLIRYKMDT